MPNTSARTVSPVAIDEAFLAKRIVNGLGRLCDRWYMRWTQRGERQVPKIIVLFSSLENDIGSFSTLKIKRLLERSNLRNKRCQLICAFDWSEEEIAAKLESLRVQKWTYQTERDQTVALFVVKGRVFQTELPFSQTADYRLQLIWGNPETLAEQDEIEEVLATQNTPSTE